MKRKLKKKKKLVSFFLWKCSADEVFNIYYKRLSDGLLQTNISLAH